MLSVLVGTICFFAQSAPTVLAQDQRVPTYSVEVVAVNQHPLPGGSVSSISLAPGDTFTVHILVRDWSPNGQMLRGFQASVDANGYESGSSGRIEPVDFETTSAVGEPNWDHGIIDEDHPRWAHKGYKAISIVDTVTPGYRWMSVTYKGDGPACPQDGTKFYIGTVHMQVTDDAQGKFTLGLIEEPWGSALKDTDDYMFSDVAFEALTIDVPAGAVRERVIATEPFNSSIDAREPVRLGRRNRQETIIKLHFNVDPSGVSAADIMIVDGSKSPPKVQSVRADGVVLSAVLDRDLTPGTWTTITHSPSGTSTRIGSLPGDVNNDGTSDADDVLSLLNALNGTSRLPIHCTDINHNGQADAADVVRLIDLVTGAHSYATHLEK